MYRLCAYEYFYEECTYVCCGTFTSCSKFHIAVILIFVSLTLYKLNER